MVLTHGTILNEAMRMSAGIFNVKESRFKTDIFISGGEDQDPNALQTAEDLVIQGVMLCTVGQYLAVDTSPACENPKTRYDKILP